MRFWKALDRRLRVRQGRVGRVEDLAAAESLQGVNDRDLACRQAGDQVELRNAVNGLSAVELALLILHIKVTAIFGVAPLRIHEHSRGSGAVHWTPEVYQQKRCR